MLLDSYQVIFSPDSLAFPSLLLFQVFGVCLFFYQKVGSFFRMFKKNFSHGICLAYVSPNLKLKEFSLSPHWHNLYCLLLLFHHQNSPLFAFHLYFFVFSYHFLSVYVAMIFALFLKWQAKFIYFKSFVVFNIASLFTFTTKYCFGCIPQFLIIF